MKKVLFVYPNVGKTLQTCQGIASMAAYLIAQGIDVQLHDCTFENSTSDFHDKLQAYNPDFVCFTSLSPDYFRVKYMADIVKNYCNAKIIIGGPHVTFLPMEAIADDYFDVVIQGEGEYALYNYIVSESSTVSGTIVKDKNVIYRNPIGVIPDVSSLPMPNHDMFSRHFKKAATWSGHTGNYAAFITARGCPFHCTYCYSKGMADLYNGQRYTRYRRIDDVIEEVGYVKEKYELTALYFIDETLTTNKARIYELCEKYKKTINIPWHCETRPNTVDQDILNAMADAGCEVIMMGIESGSERIRNGVYNRNLSEKQIIDAFDMAHKAGIKTSAFNIVGAPSETYTEALSTIDLNHKCNIDFGKMTTFNLFPGSEMWNEAKRMGLYVSSKYPENYYTHSNMKHDVMSVEEIQHIRRLYVESIGGYTGSSKKDEV